MIRLCVLRKSSTRRYTSGGRVFILGVGIECHVYSPYYCHSVDHLTHYGVVIYVSF